MTSIESSIDLLQGWPSLDLLPVQLIHQATQSLLSNPDLSASSLTYGPESGPQTLRDELSRFLSNFYSSSHINASCVSITGGASSGLASILQVYTDPAYTKHVYMIAPTYFLASRIFEENGFAGRLRAIPEDSEGVDINALERSLVRDDVQNGWLENKQSTKQTLQSQKYYKSVIYCVPTFSNPSGAVMSQRRREAMVRLARRHDALVIADDVYDFLCWDKRYESCAVAQRLVDIDCSLDGGLWSRFGNVISNGSFSKILGPGLRTGWIQSTPTFAEGLAQCGLVRSGGAPSQFAACIIAEALRVGSLQQHLFGPLHEALRHRYLATLEAIKKHLIPLGVYCKALNAGASLPETKTMDSFIHGGYYIYIQLPNRVDVINLASQAIEEANLVLAFGARFEVKGDEQAAPCKNSIRICIAWEPQERLTEGIQRLAKVLRQIDVDVSRCS